MPNLTINEDGTIQFTEEQEKWLQALESKDFLQGSNQLHTSEGDRHYYCCLGIACKTTAIHQAEQYSGSNRHSTYSYNGATAVLPDDVAVVLGLRTTEGSFNLSEEWYDTLLPDTSQAIDGVRGHHSMGFLSTSLTQLNDHGISFATIAAIIRSNPPGLFRKD